MTKDNEQDVTRKSGIVYAAVISFFISTLGLLGVGWLLDRWLGTEPWLLVVGIIAGASLGFYQFIRTLSRIS